ncbi:hypothetical protein [Microcoleus sp. herbarium14]|uniref:hypothetical protein n=1 Tax=Microcoleus sp. herbarium14 TaxID=3055439 RepID=UPI002FCF53B3
MFVGAGLRDDRSEAIIVGKTRPYNPRSHIIVFLGAGLGDYWSEIQVVGFNPPLAIGYYFLALTYLRRSLAFLCD